MRALDFGADDYVCTPFGVQELLARVRVALRHAARLPSGLRPMFTAGSLTIDIEQRLVLIHGQEVKLTPTEDERIAIHTPYVVPLVLDPHPHSLFAHIFREGAEKGTSLFAS